MHVFEDCEEDVEDGSRLNNKHEGIAVVETPNQEKLRMARITRSGRTLRDGKGGTMQPTVLRGNQII